MKYITMDLWKLHKCNLQNKIPKQHPLLFLATFDLYIYLYSDLIWAPQIHMQPPVILELPKIAQ